MTTHNTGLCFFCKKNHLTYRVFKSPSIGISIYVKNHLPVGLIKTTNNDILEGKRAVISVINYNLYYLEIIYLHVNIHTPVFIFYRMETYNLMN